MKICGIIVEYNPFHNGHLYHIEKAREMTQCDVLIAVMSGNFVQRGEPAIIDKWKRAKQAIDSGVDCVFELPYLYATQSASHFAKGAISLLKLAQVNSIVFGSESNNIEELMDMASLNIHMDHIKEEMSEGHSFPKAYGLLTKSMGPNDILGVSYLREIQNTSIIPYCIQRTIHYHDPNLYLSISSASAIRQAFFENKEIHHNTPMSELLKKSSCLKLEDYYPYLRILLTTLPSTYLSSIFLFNEGIENHLKQQASHYSTFDDFLAHSTTRRYTASRIRRCCIQLLHQVKKEEAQSFPQQIPLRPLVFNETGKSFLKYLKENEIPVASKFSQLPESYRNLEYRSTELYGLLLPENERVELLKKERGGALFVQSSVKST